MRKIIFNVLAFFCPYLAQAQEFITPVHSNKEIKSHLLQLNKMPHLPYTALSGNDTLSLPFIDDFSGSSIYPDTNKWTDRAVYINNSFPINPPSYNVATFDALNRFGDAYNNTGFDPYGFADTLSSKAINLSASTPADSVYLSFYIQAQGIGFDSLSRRDSLTLEFYNQFGVWVRVWQTGGRRPAPFEYVLIPVANPNYFHAGFRFRWMNRVGLSGNLNHWHLDYVRLDRFRNMADTTYKDISINNPFRSLLRNYRSMPWKQFKNSAQNEETDSLYIRARNLDNLLTQVVHQYKSYNSDGLLIAQDSNRLNIPGNDTALYRLRQVGIPTTLSEDSFYRITTVYRVFSTFDLNRRNDSLVHRQEFSNYFAYDDGTAESGYGIIGSGGKVALRYKLNKPDTLRAIRIYFNQAETDVRNKPFSLALWSELGNKEKLRYSQSFNGPVYTDEVNGFATLVLDTPQFLDAVSYPGGVFYIGWIQGTDFVLNVGLDVNYASMLGASAAINPNLSFYVGSSWQPSLVKGALMMRPVLGTQVDDPLSVPEKLSLLPKDKFVQVYPNPVSEQVTVMLNQPQPVDVIVYSASGVVVYNEPANDSLHIPVSNWSRGIYFAVVKNRQTGAVNTVKFLKQ